MHVETCSDVILKIQQKTLWISTSAGSRLQVTIGAGSGVPGGAQAPPELFLAPPEPFEPPLTIKTIMH